MYKKLFGLMVFLIVVSWILAACGTVRPADVVVKQVVSPPTVPVMKDPIKLAIGQPVEITNGEVTLTLEYQGKDSFGKFKWTCLDEQGNSCAERHGDQSDMVFYHEFKLVGATMNDSFMLVSGWEVKLYP